tara:strand:- start:23103 stop:23282 length:180 start_codon:yes stop_codon:yes gene_type:complete
MKFTTILVATMATLTVANPLAPTSDVKDTANAVARDDCAECNRLYDSCRGVSISPIRSA